MSTTTTKPTMATTSANRSQKKGLRTNRARPTAANFWNFSFTELQLYALWYWYEQYHVLEPDAKPATLLSGKELVEVLLSKMSKDEVDIFRERLDLILSHYPERQRWNRKLRGRPLVGGGLGMEYDVRVGIWDDEYLHVTWEKVTDEEKGFEWWW